MKRIVDFTLSFFGLIVASPLLLPTMLAVWLQDFKSPFYISDRVGKDEKLFRMVKLRSMVKGADKSGVDSTSASDPRITAVGRFIRKYKLDELSQLWNVLVGDMSLVGPRPNVKRETDLYTSVEKRLLSVRPGITDVSSIVFADENDILKDSEDPDIAYNQLIRPWKSKLGLLYIDSRSIALDLQLILLTISNSLNRSKTLIRLNRILVSLGADEKILRVSLREDQLVPSVPPGGSGIVSSR